MVVAEVGLEQGIIAGARVGGHGAEAGVEIVSAAVLGIEHAEGDGAVVAGEAQAGYASGLARGGGNLEGRGVVGRVGGHREEAAPQGGDFAGMVRRVAEDADPLFDGRSGRVGAVLAVDREIVLVVTVGHARRGSGGICRTDEEAAQNAANNRHTGCDPSRFHGAYSPLPTAICGSFALPRYSKTWTRLL